MSAICLLFMRIKLIIPHNRRAGQVFQEHVQFCNLIILKKIIDFLINLQYNGLIMNETRELVSRCLRKEPAAWDQFVRRYEALVTRSVRHKLKKLNFRLRKEEYRDIVQEIFTSIWEKDKLSKLRDPDRLRGWLAIVSLNFTSNYCSRKRFKQARTTFSLDEELAGESRGLTLRSVLSSAKLNTAKAVEANELGATIDKEISTLVPKQQLALKLNILDGKTQKEISSIMNVPEGTVATLISRAKKQLRQNLTRVLGASRYL
ncbi:MAG: sigma-70 family RNA polymerase sigma factor [Candidatus Omnitrophica bacterium]|nr:sigma-70 family RNA polymerase sigma factor [Candidatus Omnitrophota bacterium]